MVAPDDSPMTTAFITAPLGANLVMNLHDPVGKRLDRTERERLLAMPRRDQRNPLADEHRHDADDELVDRSRVEERSDDLAPAHHPDVLAPLFAQPRDKALDRLADEFDASRRRRRGR